MKKEDILCPFKSLHDAVVFSSKDWSLTETNAWIYGIVVGWDVDSLNEIKRTFKWSDELVDRLKLLHEAFPKR